MRQQEVVSVTKYFNFYPPPVPAGCRDLALTSPCQGSSFPWERLQWWESCGMGAGPSASQRAWLYHAAAHLSGFVTFRISLLCSFFSFTYSCSFTSTPYSLFLSTRICLLFVTLLLVIFSPSFFFPRRYFLLSFFTFRSYILLILLLPIIFPILLLIPPIPFIFQIFFQLLHSYIPLPILVFTNPIFL